MKNQQKMQENIQISVDPVRYLHPTSDFFTSPVWQLSINTRWSCAQYSQRSTFWKVKQRNKETNKSNAFQYIKFDEDLILWGSNLHYISKIKLYEDLIKYTQYIHLPVAVGSGFYLPCLLIMLPLTCSAPLHINPPAHVFGRQRLRVHHTPRFFW